MVGEFWVQQDYYVCNKLRNKDENGFHIILSSMVAYFELSEKRQFDMNSGISPTRHL